MSTSPIPSSVPSLPTLPVEIMRMIASHALQQDQEFREKKDIIHEIQDEEFYPPREDVKEGNSLNALFLLDRAWSAVAAPLLFRRLTSPNCNSPLFRGVILPKFASFVEEAAFSMGEGLSEEEGAAEDANDKELMISLPLFPRLRRLELYAYHAFTFLSLSVLHGAAARPSQEVKIHRQSFCYAVRNVKELVLHNSTAPVFSWVLLAMPAPERLSIRGLLSGDGEEEPNPMTKEGERRLFETSVADCQNLVELDIVDEHAWASPDDRIGFGDSWREHEWTCRSTLRSLSIIRAGEDLAESVWSFAQHFADSLEVLKLGRLTGNTAADEVLHPRQIGSQTVEFPHLHTLNAGITDSTFPILLRRFSSSPLRRLELCLTDDDNVSEDFFSTQLISTLKTHHSTLREVSLRSNYGRAHASERYKRLVLPLGDGSRFGITLSNGLDTWSELTHNSRWLSSQQPQHRQMTRERCDGIDDVARFALNLSGRLRATGDIYGAEAMMEAMQPLRALMAKEQL